jgi:hypothetical protein
VAAVEVVTIQMRKEDQEEAREGFFIDHHFGFRLALILSPSVKVEVQAGLARILGPE